MTPLVDLRGYTLVYPRRQIGYTTNSKSSVLGLILISPYVLVRRWGRRNRNLDFHPWRNPMPFNQKMKLCQVAFQCPLFIVHYFDARGSSQNKLNCLKDLGKNVEHLTIKILVPYEKTHTKCTRTGFDLSFEIISFLRVSIIFPNI